MTTRLAQPSEMPRPSAISPIVAEQQFVDATRAGGFVATGFVILGVVFSFLLPATKPRPAEVAEAAAAA